MMKHVTNSYVLKFVGGEGQDRRCHYCRDWKKSSVLCVYGNTMAEEDDAIFICPDCLLKGCKESEEQWAAIAKRANLIDLVTPQIPQKANWLDLIRAVVACEACMEANQFSTASKCATENAVFCPGCAERVAKAILDVRTP